MDNTYRMFILFTDEFHYKFCSNDSCSGSIVGGGTRRLNSPREHCGTHPTGTVTEISN